MLVRESKVRRGRTPSAPSSGSCTSAAGRPRRAPQPKGPRSSRPPFASHDEDGLAMHALVQRVVEHGARALTQDGGDLEAGRRGLLAQVLDGVVAVALPAHGAAPQAVALVGEDVDD